VVLIEGDWDDEPSGWKLGQKTRAVRVTSSEWLSADDKRALVRFEDALSFERQLSRMNRLLIIKLQTSSENCDIGSAMKRWKPAGQ
jgi:hypothetical protein